MERNGLSGGLTLFWHDDFVIVHILSSSVGHIDVKIAPVESMPKWRFTEFYGHLATKARGHSWTLLCCLSTLHYLPLALWGFNEILTHKEKTGTNRCSNGQITVFREALLDRGLQDLGFEGNPFT